MIQITTTIPITTIMMMTARRRSIGVPVSPPPSVTIVISPEKLSLIPD
jgi:hypothetical protein